MRDGWIATSVTTEEASSSIAIVRAHAESAGRDPDTLACTSGYTLDPCDDGRRGTLASILFADRAPPTRFHAPSKTTSTRRESAQRGRPQVLLRP